MQKHLICIFMLALVLQLQPITATALEPYAAKENELALMPSYCQAKLGKDRGNQAISNKWGAIYGVDWGNMHHYCDALKFIIRADRSIRNKADLGFNLQNAAFSIEHLLTSEQTPDWILRSEAHVKLGEVILRMAKIGKASEGKAIQNFQQAIIIQPNYEPAYSALSDFYVNKGLKQKALNTVEEGLKNIPDSKILLRRFKELGGKTPPAPVVVTQQTAPNGAANSPVKQEQAGSATSSSPSDVPASSSPETSQEQATPSKIGSPSNPWCRFCPNIEDAPKQK